MAQTIIVILIVVLAAIAAAFKLYKFFKSTPETVCGPGKCASCPYTVRETCDKKDAH
jgi:hypothetical protein